jgi:hypothetical protein
MIPMVMLMREVSLLWIRPPFICDLRSKSEAKRRWQRHSFFLNGDNIEKSQFQAPNPNSQAKSQVPGSKPEEKLQIPNLKVQTNSNIQTPNPKEIPITKFQ